MLLSLSRRSPTPAGEARVSLRQRRGWRRVEITPGDVKATSGYRGIRCGCATATRRRSAQPFARALTAHPSNADSLHHRILPGLRRTDEDVLAEPRLVVIDEAHAARGARVTLRQCHGECYAYARMRQLEAEFICTSATISNPREHVKAPPRGSVVVTTSGRHRARNQ